MRIRVKGKDVPVNQKIFIAYCMGLLDEEMLPFSSYIDLYLEQELDIDLFSARWCREMGLPIEKVSPILNHNKYQLLLREVTSPAYMHCVLYYMWGSGYIPLHLDGTSPLWERELWLLNSLREVILYSKDSSIVGGLLSFYYEAASCLEPTINDSDMNLIMRGHTPYIDEALSIIDGQGLLIRNDDIWVWVDPAIRTRLCSYSCFKLAEDTLTKACQQIYSGGPPY